jgi:hypothetical protein
MEEPFICHRWGDPGRRNSAAYRTGGIIMRVFLPLCFGLLLICWTLPCYGQGYNDLENIALEATVEAEGSDIPVENVKDGNFTTRWNATNDDVDTWIEFTWTEPQKINRVHITEFRHRVSGHTIEWGDNLDEVENLKLDPENPDDAQANHPGNQQQPVEIPDHKLTFATVTTTTLRYHMTKATGPSDEPSLWEIEIFFDPELATPVHPAGCLPITWARLKL